MKIGILTFHRAHNYGAVLQCYALQEVLKGMGHEVEVIDYRQEAIEKSNNKIKYGSVFKNRFSFSQIKYFLYLLIKEPIARKKYNRFLIRYLSVKHTCSHLGIPKNYDYYVIGSDQLFNLQITEGLDPVYSGMFKKAGYSKLIGYAISANIESVQKIGRDEWFNIIKRFSAFSFREKRLSNYLSRTFSLNVEVCIDPTLLLNNRKWDNLNCSNFNCKSYIVLYEVRFAENKRHELKRKAKILAKCLDTKVINLSRMTYSVEEWVNYIKNAKCVITSSFHASVFGLIFNRPLYSFMLGDEGDSRYVDLLESVGANNCLKSIDDDIMNLPQMDYELINRNLQGLREQSKSFLTKTIK